MYSECFASADIGAAHVERSSGGAEVIGVGNATQDILHLSPALYRLSYQGLVEKRGSIDQNDNLYTQRFANITEVG